MDPVTIAVGSAAGLWLLEELGKAFGKVLCRHTGAAIFKTVFGGSQREQLSHREVISQTVASVRGVIKEEIRDETIRVAQSKLNAVIFDLTNVYPHLGDTDAQERYLEGRERILSVDVIASLELPDTKHVCLIAWVIAAALRMLILQEQVRLRPACPDRQTSIENCAYQYTQYIQETMGKAWRLRAAKMRCVAEHMSYRWYSDEIHFKLFDEDKELEKHAIKWPGLKNGATAAFQEDEGWEVFKVRAEQHCNDARTELETALQYDCIKKVCRAWSCELLPMTKALDLSTLMPKELTRSASLTRHLHELEDPLTLTDDSDLSRLQTLAGSQRALSISPPQPQTPAQLPQPAADRQDPEASECYGWQDENEPDQFSVDIILDKLHQVVRENRLQAFYTPERLKDLAGSFVHRNLQELGRRWQLSFQATLDLVGLLLYDVCVFIDDGESMRSADGGARLEDLKAVLGSIAEAATIFDPDGAFVRFKNSSVEGNSIHDATEASELIQKAFKGFAYSSFGYFSGGTSLASSLDRKLLKPWVLDQARKQSGVMDKPVLVICMIDTVPYEDPDRRLQQAMCITKTNLSETCYDKGAVALQFTQIGWDSNAMMFLHAMSEDLEDPDKRCMFSHTRPYNYGQELAKFTRTHSGYSGQVYQDGAMVISAVHSQLVKVILGAINSAYSDRAVEVSNLGHYYNYYS